MNENELYEKLKKDAHKLVNSILIGDCRNNQILILEDIINDVDKIIKGFKEEINELHSL